MTTRKITRRQFTAMAGAGALVTFAPATSRFARAQAMVKITAAEAVETLYYLPMYVAKAKGFYEEQGLDVTIFNAQQRTIALRAVVSGDAFSYNGDPAEPAIARQRGVDVKNIGVLVARAGGVIIGKPEYPKDPKNWAGLRIITPRPPHTSVSLVRMVLLDNGFTQADQDGMQWRPSGSSDDKDLVRLTPVVAGSELAALSANQAELSIVIEPNTSVALSQGFESKTSFAEQFGPFYYTSYAVMNETIKNQPEQVQKFANAMQKAFLWGHANPDEAAKVAMERYSTQDAAIITQAAKGIIAREAYPRSLVVTKEMYEKNFDRLLVATGHPAANYPFDELMDLRFAEEAELKVKI